MITLSVVSFNDMPADGALGASFDELGGGIGRADSNHLVLPDPDRTISRVAAQVVYRNGGYAIVDRGSNPTLVNGKALGSGREAPLKAGDRVRIGGYELAVSVSAAKSASAASSDPFADLLGPAVAAPAAGGLLFDPLAGAGAASAARAAPVAPGWPATGHAAASSPASGWPASAPTAPAPAGAAGGIPNDWDPFAPDPVPAPRGLAAGSQHDGRLGLDLGAAAPGQLVAGLGVPTAEPSSLDQLFGLGPSSGADPLANSLLAAPAALPNMGADVDPLRSLDSAPRAGSASLPDLMSDLNQPFMPPPTRAPVTTPAAFPPPVASAIAPAFSPAITPAIPPAIPPAASPNLPAAPRGAVMSWDTEGDVSHTVIRPAGSGALAAAPMPAAVPEAQTIPSVRITQPPPMIPDLDDLGPLVAPPSALATPRAAEPPITPPVLAPVAARAAAVPEIFAAPAPPPAPAPVTGADNAALLEAFCRGLQTPRLQNTVALTPELMELVGQLLHEATRGTVDLLVARAAFKRELRAQATTISARENNPLKFSPSAEAALQHLLSPPVRGFMPAAPAMRDAFNDLRAHQMGFIAGLQAALDGVLRRFDPAELEKQLTERSMLHSLLPGSRKARMWEVFIEHYARIGAEAADDFHTLFGTAFLKAYEEQIDRLDEESAP